MVLVLQESLLFSFCGDFVSEHLQATLLSGYVRKHLDCHVQGQLSAKSVPSLFLSGQQVSLTGVSLLVTRMVQMRPHSN